MLYFFKSILRFFFNFLSILFVLNQLNANLITNENLVGKRPLGATGSSGSGSSPFEDSSESLRKNDDSHLRLYYKSNSPERSVSHELEHRYIKNPNYNQYNHRVSQETNNFPQQQLKFSSPYYFDPRLYQANQLQQQQVQNTYPNMFADSDRNKLMMQNINYHANVMDNFGDQNLNQRPDFQQLQMQQQNQQSSARNNLLRMLLLNGDATFLQQQQLHHQQQLQQQQQQLLLQQPFGHQNFRPTPFNQPYLNDQGKNDNGIQYKIVHLKFKIEPQQGRVLGQGFVETNNGGGPPIMNARRFALMPNEMPEFVKRLLSNPAHGQFQQPPQIPNLMSPYLMNQHHSSLIKKRQDDESRDETRVTNESDGLEKRADDSSVSENESDVEEQAERGYIKPHEDMGITEDVGRRKDDEDDKVNDSEFNESFKSLQKRSVESGDSNDDSSAGAEEENLSREMSLRGDDDSNLDGEFSENSENS